MSNYLAFDLGAESGRAMLGTLEGGRLRLEELHRFLNQPVRVPDGLYWDTFRLFHDIREGLRIAGRERQLVLNGVAVDTWGVDYGLLDSNGELCQTPRHYRDPRNNAAYDAALAAAGRENIFNHTGLQFMPLNSLYQLYAARLAGTPALDIATRLLFMPDLLSYWLCGVQKNELTIASTSQFYNPAQKRWSTELFETLGLPPAILGDIVLPGTRLGGLLDEIRDTCALGPTPVFATAGHDTASAVAAVPATGERSWCYISSGTWSLMGVEIDEPVVTPKALELTLTNEVGVEGKVRLLKNIAGLWLVQECRRAWILEGKEYTYAELTEMAAGADPFLAVLDPDQFLDPGHMPERIAAYCRSTGQPVPERPGQFVRICLESLALRYRQVLESLEALVGFPIEVIHIVGGGSRNGLLNRFVAEATARTVVAGPNEATAAGNILVQAMGAGEIAGLPHLRQVVRDSFDLETIDATRDPAWDRAYQRFLRLK
ncbi:MAG: rhamnulokinase [Bryobacterales bacterium]|nr:rhamnulokinase [Bryobacterales bacterium]